MALGPWGLKIILFKYVTVYNVHVFFSVTMNQPRSRTRSAGVSQRTSMTGDVHMLQDTVVHLQQQLLQARNDNNKVKDQLNCLITLVQQSVC